MFVVAILLFITEKVTGELKYELFKSEFVCFEIQRGFQFIMGNLIDIWIDSEYISLKIVFE